MSRPIFEDVIGKRDVRGIWGAGFPKALGLTPQNFVLGSVLPAVLFMMRYGHRRGRGKFAERFGAKASVEDIARQLVNDRKSFIGFDSDAEISVLADLLLSYCLENKKHKLGRDEEVLRGFPTHYFSSWVDLPPIVAHLRAVPEMFTAITAEQAEGAFLKPGGEGHFPISDAFANNILLRLFGAGTRVETESHSLRADAFDETTEVGIDQLLTIRVAQSLGEAPASPSGESGFIPNQLSLAARASRFLYEDFDVFIRSYGDSMPRQALVPLIESCLAVGFTNIFLSSLKIILNWSESGTVAKLESQTPWALFVDCSASTDESLRRISEEGIDDLLHRMARVSVSCVCMRILDQRAEQERIEGLPSSYPDPSTRIQFLGDLLFERHSIAGSLKRDLNRDCNRLADALREEDDAATAEILQKAQIVHPAWRLAEATVYSMGQKQQGDLFRKFADSVLMMDQPNGLGRKRRRMVRGAFSERRSLVLTNTILDFLVHRHLRKAAGAGVRQLSLNQFIAIMKERYGFYVDEAPAGMSIPDEILRRNRSFLEKRLRDLGLFIGVNDAEAMKRLKPRFAPSHYGDQEAAHNPLGGYPVI